MKLANAGTFVTNLPDLSILVTTHQLFWIDPLIMS